MEGNESVFKVAKILLETYKKKELLGAMSSNCLFSRRIARRAPNGIVLSVSHYFGFKIQS